MCIKVCGARCVNCETFSTEKVIAYLQEALSSHIEKRAELVWNKTIMAAYKGKAFMISADKKPYFEICFNEEDVSVMKEVVQKLKEWSDLKNAESGIICELKQNETHTVIFDISTSDINLYMLQFEKYCVNITTF